MELRTNSKGREYAVHNGRVSYDARDVAAAKAGRGPVSDLLKNATGPAFAGDEDTNKIKAPKAGAACRPQAAITLKGRPVMDVCDEDLIPLAQGILDRLRERVGGPDDVAELRAAAQARAAGDCCDERGVSVGAELGRVLVDEMLRQGVGPGDWLRIMPRELAIVGTVPGATVEDAGVASLWSRFAGGASAALVGARLGGAPGAAVLGLLGVLWPDIAATAAGTGATPSRDPAAITSGIPGGINGDPNTNGQIPLFGGGERSNMLKASGGVIQTSAGSSGSANKGGQTGLQLGPLGVNVSDATVGLLERLLRR